MEYIDLRKLNSGELKQIRRQVVRLKELGKTGKEIEELTGVRQNRTSEIWTAYRRGTRGAGGNTRNDYHTPPRGIRYSWQFMDVEESVHIRLEKVSEKDIGR